MNKFGKYLFLLLLIETVSAGMMVSVKIGHPVYRFLDRMETLGVLDNIRDGVKPFERKLVADFLVKIDAQREKLTDTDRRRLDNFLLDFRFEIDISQKYAPLREGENWYSPLSGFDSFGAAFNRLIKQNVVEEENHVILWEDSTNSFYFDFAEHISHTRRSADSSRWRQSETYSLRGSLSENFGYALNVTFARVQGDDGYRDREPVLKNTWVNEREGGIFFDRSGGEIVYRSPFVDLRVAQQPVSWGPGRSGKLILSDNVEPYPYISLSRRWSWGGFYFMHGKLQSEAGADSIEGRPLYPDKWLAANRFEFSPASFLTIGLSGMVLYGNRGAEWAYMMPFNYFRATEHTLRDRDNALLAIDAEANLGKGIKLYGTLLLDELKQSKLFTDWYGNKHGFQIGGHIADPFMLPDLELRLEYVAIMPWVYTHKFTLNSFASDGRSLGHWAGPNAQVFFAEITKDWHHRFITGFRYQQWKQGRNFEDENVGGDLFTGHNILLGTQTQARETRRFLEGILYTEEMYSFFSHYEVFNDVYLDFSFSEYNITLASDRQSYRELHFGLKFEY